MKRRTLLAAIPAAAAATMAGLSRNLAAQDQTLQPLDLSNPSAKALNYQEDIASADPAVYNPESGEKCGNCTHFKGADQARGGCALFPGYSVSANGWCSGWVESG